VQQWTTAAEQRTWSREQRTASQRIGLVPTMGALHEGHAALIRRALADCDQVVVSIFVNPTQFDDAGDLEQYPRSLEADLALCRELGVHAVFTPQREAMFPEGYATFVEVVGPLTDKLCGIARPGHFRGVATVVTKLLNIVEPDAAYFGQKDLQQALVISRLVSDLDLPVAVEVCPTVRDPDGLALSSRNRKLAADRRAVALALPRGLERANRAFADGERDVNALLELVATELLVHPGVDLDYAHVVQLPGFTEVDDHADEQCVLAAAAFVDDVRLIDHVHLGGDGIPVDLDG